MVPAKWLENFLSVCKTKNIKKLQDFLKSLMYEAYAASQLLEQFNEMLVSCEDLNDQQKAAVAEKLGVNRKL